MLPPSDFTRLQPTADCLNIILKSTYFRDNLLDANSTISIKIRYEKDIPILTFKFSEPYYDFLEVLKYDSLKNSLQGWLDKENIVIKLLLADSVITDQVAGREFILDIDESETLRFQLHKQENLLKDKIDDAFTYIYSNLNRFLV